MGGADARHEQRWSGSAWSPAAMVTPIYTPDHYETFVPVQAAVVSPGLGDPRIPAVVARLSEADAGRPCGSTADSVYAIALHDALRADGWHVAVIDRAPVVDKATLLRALCDSCRTDPRGAANWDALLDVLRDLSWPEPVAGIVFVWREPDAPGAHAP